MKKTILITGCSTGLGRALCENINHDEYYVVATARQLESIADVKADLRVQLDVCNEQQVKNAVQEVVCKTGRIDVLVNNAGFSVRSAVEELNLTKYQQMMDVNVFGCIRMIQAVAPLMRANGCGRILNIGSISGRMTGLVNGGYCSTKRAIEAITEAARYELKSFGIDVSVIEPGAMETSFFDTLSCNSDKAMSDVSSPYYDLYSRDMAFRRKQQRAAIEVCTKKIVTIIDRRKLKVRYTASVSAIYKLFLYMPSRMQEYLILKFN